MRRDARTRLMHECLLLGRDNLQPPGAYRIELGMGRWSGSLKYVCNVWFDEEGCDPQCIAATLSSTRAFDAILHHRLLRASRPPSIA